MMWAWDQSAGALSGNGKVVAKGYSAAARGKTNASMQAAAGASQDWVIEVAA